MLQMSRFVRAQNRLSDVSERVKIIKNGRYKLWRA